jgi:glycosyltransferase involved in cell wall biosynthesis
MMPLPIYKMNNPLFSIIIPTYNRAERNAKTVQSALNQTIGDFELIIVDDGSTDNTEEIIKSLLDPRIHYFKKNNEERAIARNYGIHRAKGDYITFLDSDDQLFPHFLDEAQKVIEQNNRPEWFHLAYEIVDEKGVIIRQENKRKGDINKSLIRGNHLSCIGVFIRKDILEKYQFNDDPEIIGSEDYLLWLKLASLYPLHYSNTTSACMIQHDGRSVINFNKQQLIRRIEKSIYYATNDPSISNFLKGKISKFKAHRYLYLANHLSRATYKKASLKYYFLSIIHFPLILFHRNSLSYLKSLFIL